MLRRSMLAGALIALLVACDASAQRVPVADNAIENAEVPEWPTVEEIGIPLYPDLEAFMIGERPTVKPGADVHHYVNFASQADVMTVLAWYDEHAEGWAIDENGEMMLPEGADAMDARSGRSGFVFFSEMGGSCWDTVPCETMVQISYKPGA